MKRIQVWIIFVLMLVCGPQLYSCWIKGQRPPRCLPDAVEGMVMRLCIIQEGGLCAHLAHCIVVYQITAARWVSVKY